MRVKGFLRRPSVVVDRLYVEGTVVARSLRARVLVGRGVIVADSLAADYAVFTGSINAERGVGDTLVLRGDIRIGDLRGGKVVVEGRLRAASVRAEGFTLRASSLSRMSSLSSRRAEILSRPPALRGRPRVHVGELRAERLYAEFLVAGRLAARLVELGPMCSVEVLRYCESLSMDNTVTLGGPPEKLCVGQRPSITERS
ncbi:MAG: hypothetical protein QI199_06430 [Candidatus Korarchaeota archaeon]|nr:hypothetical protein [Candidatus Korarchaeota archaeon]